MGPPRHYHFDAPAPPLFCVCVTRASAAPRAAPQADRKPSPLQRGGTLQGAAAAGKDASDKFKAAAEGKMGSGPVLQVGAGAG